MATCTKKMKKHIFLHPMDKKRRQGAVRTALLRDKNKYSDRLVGALLDVNNLQVIGDKHLVVDGFLSMEVCADFNIFCPKPGMELDGVINKLSTSHMGCLVMNTFNASLSLPVGMDVSPRVGDLCHFTVDEVVVDGEILFMRGTLLSVTPSGKTSVKDLTTDDIDNQEEDLGPDDIDNNIEWKPTTSGHNIECADSATPYTDRYDEEGADAHSSSDIKELNIRIKQEVTSPELKKPQRHKSPKRSADELLHKRVKKSPKKR